MKVNKSLQTSNVNHQLTATRRAHLAKMSQLPSSVLFSPSLARAHIAQTKDWNYIDAWLLRHLSKPPPPFERNAETLKALLALAAHNEAADEERSLLARVEEKALQELKEMAENDPDKEMLEMLEGSLIREGSVALETLAEMSVQLNLPVPEVEKMGIKIVNVQAEVLQLEQASDRITILENHLKKELKNINKIVENLQFERYQPPADIAKQTSDYQRKTKALSARVPELKDRVKAQQAGFGKELITIEDVKMQEDRYREQLGIVKDLEAQVKTFHGLPSDTDLARLELESLRVELRELTLERDRMFEGLVERESPKKRR